MLKVKVRRIRHDNFRRAELNVIICKIVRKKRGEILEERDR